MQIKKNLILVFITIFLFFIESTCVFAQQAEKNDIELIKKMGDSIITQSTFDFYVLPDSAILKSIKADNDLNTVFIKSPYNEWRYWNGVLHLAMLKLSEVTNDKRYKDFVVKNYDFAFDNVKQFEKKFSKESVWNYPFNTLFTTTQLDDCGAEGAGLAEVASFKPRKEYLNYLTATSNYILKKQSRLFDGTLIRQRPAKNTIWADDLYMGVIFLAKMGKLTGEKKYFDDAVKQVINFEKYLSNKQNGLYYHGWYNDVKLNNVAHWGRCNGWVMMAEVELLDCLPKNHPQRKKLINILVNHVVGISRFQDRSGMWHQLLDKNDSYLETSATAMFVYSIAKAVNSGWIDKRYATIAVDGWEGVKTNIDKEGKVANICKGTGIRDRLSYYYNRPTPMNDIHGIGPVLLAGIEIMNLKISADDE